MIVYADGVYLPRNEARLSAMSPAVLFGASLFETVLCRRGVPLFVDDHAERMAASARSLELPVDLDAGALRAVGLELNRRNGPIDHGRLRITLVEDEGGGDAYTDPTGVTRLFLELAPFSPPGADILDGGWHLAISPHRQDPSRPLAGCKTGNYMANRLERRRAVRRGCQEALFLATDGRVLEGTATNLFVLNRGVVQTPPLSSGVLPGITRKVLLREDRLGAAPLEEADLSIQDLISAEEAFVTNALVGVIPVATADGVTVGPGTAGPATRAAARAVEDARRRETRRFLSP